MLSNETIVGTSATMIVGVFILVSVRQSMGLRSSGAFFQGMVSLVIIPFALSAVLAILSTEYADKLLAVGFLTLVVFLLRFASEVMKQEHALR